MFLILSFSKQNIFTSFISIPRKWSKTNESFEQIEEHTWLGNEHGTKCPGEVCPVQSWDAISLLSLWTLNSCNFQLQKKKGAGEIPFITQHKLLHYLAVVSIKTKSYVISTVRFLHMIFRNMWDITQSPNNVWEANIIPTHRKKCETQILNDSVKFEQLRNRNKPRNNESSSCTFHYISYNTFMNVLHDLYSIFYNKILHAVT